MGMTGRTVLVCGGRNYDNRSVLVRVLNTYRRRFGIRLLVQGGARGADALAKEWCIINDVETATVKADWAKWGRGAGTVRNEKMLRDFEVDVVIAFPGGAGTADMCRQARAAGVTILRVTQ